MVKLYSFSETFLESFAGSRPLPFGPWEREFVASKRAVRASWSAIATMLGRAEHDVRVAFDPGYGLPSTPAAAGSATSDAAKRVWPSRAGRPGPVEQRRLHDLTLIAMGERFWTAVELAKLLRENMPIVRSRLIAMRARGVVESRGSAPPILYHATQAGLDRAVEVRRAA